MNFIGSVFLNVDITSKCWNYTKKHSNDKRENYAVVSYKGKGQKAHRMAYIAAKGPIPKGMLIRHTCDNPRCINPSHLLIGTRLDNRLDREERAKIKNRKLSNRDVREIKRALDKKRSVKGIAAFYNVSERCVYAIRRGESWKNVC